MFAVPSPNAVLIPDVLLLDPVIFNFWLLLYTFFLLFIKFFWIVVFTTTLVWLFDKLVIVKLVAPRLKVSSVTALFNPLLLWTEYLSSSKVENETLVIPVISDVLTTNTPAPVVDSPVTWWFNTKFDLSKSNDDTFGSGSGANKPTPDLKLGTVKNASTDVGVDDDGKVPT